MRKHFPIYKKIVAFKLLLIIQNKSMKKIMVKRLEFPNLRKISLKMKLTTILVFTSIFLTQAESTYSQNKKISLKLESVSVMEVLETIEALSEFKFLGNENVISDNRIVSLHVKKKRIYGVLNELFEGTDVTYNVLDKQIILKLNTSVRELKTSKPILVEEATSEIQEIEIQEIEITGVVNDGDGDPLPGATILEKGTSNGTSTDFNGNFSLKVPNANATLVVSFVGFLSQEIVAGQEKLTIVLLEDKSNLDEIVVVGYGTQKKENLTSAVAVVNTDLLEDRIVDSPANLLYGLASGVTVTSNTGMPGSSAIIQIRESSTYKNPAVTERAGAGNLVLRNYANDRPVAGVPLFVIDGTIRTSEDFSNLNPTDIASLTVLKDAASTAIYGMRGGDGVVLVTTKRGKSGQASINYTTSYSTSAPTIDLEYFNAYDQSIRDNLTFDHLGQPADYIGRYTSDELEFYKNNSYNLWDRFWENPTVKKHDLAISGGNADTKYYISGSLMNNEGAFNNSFNKHTFLARLDGKITNDLSFTLTMNGNESESISNGDGNSSRGNTGYALARDLQGADPRDPGVIDGIATTPATDGWLNPDYSTNTQTAKDILVKGELEYKIPGVDGLSLKGSYVHQNRHNYNRMWRGVQYKSYWLTKGGNGHIFDALDVNRVGGPTEQNGGGFNGEDRRLYEETQGLASHQSNISLNYANTFGNHNVAAFVGLEESANDGRNLWTQTDGFVDSTQDYNLASVGYSDPDKRAIGGEVIANTAVSSFITRVDYNFAQKYIFGFTLRADRSYKFPKDNQIGVFPAASAGWNIHKESFFNTSGTLNTLKLRGSYGVTGSDNTGAFQYQNTYLLRNGNRQFETLIPQKLLPGVVGNPAITWEKNYSSNIAVDAGLFDNKLNVSVDAWNRRTEDILDTRIAVIPVSVGARLPAVNYAEGKAWGVDVSAGYNNQVGELSYSLNMVWSSRDSEYVLKDQTNNVRDYLNQIGQPMFGTNLGYISEGVIRTQADIDRIYLDNGADFKILGRDPQLGDLMFKDIRGRVNADNPDEPDGQITNDDREIINFKKRPGNTYGFNFSFGYKGFTLNAIMQGVYNYEDFAMNGATAGNSKLWGKTMYLEDPVNGGPIPNTQTGIIGFGLGQSTNVLNNNRENSTYWLRDMSYLRMKSITLSYRVPEKITKATKVLKGIRIFGGVENPFYIYNAVSDLSIDPELGGGGGYFNYPIMRTFSAGLNLTF